MIELRINPTHIDSELVNFPVYVDLAEMPASFWSGLGDETVAVYDAGLTKLDRELVWIDKVGQAGELWFRAPSISSTVETVFHLVPVESESNTAGVWKSSYQTVMHLNEGSSTTADHYKDSTVNVRHGTGGPDATNHPNAPQSITGIHGNAVRTNGVDELMATGDFNFGAGGGGSSELTIRAWVRRQATAQSSRSVIVGKRASYEATSHVGIRLNTSNQLQGEMEIGGWTAVTSPNTLPLDTWVLAHARYQINGMLEIFENGVSVATIGPLSNAVTDYTTPLSIGGFFYNTAADDNRRFHGDVDEMRLSTEYLSNAWIKAEYQNEANFTSFMTASAASPDIPTVETVSATNITETSALLTGEVTSMGAYTDIYCGFRWRQSGQSGWDMVPPTTGIHLTAPGTYSTTLGGLVSGLTYEYQAAGAYYSEGSVDEYWAYGSIKTFQVGQQEPIDPGGDLRASNLSFSDNGSQLRSHGRGANVTMQNALREVSGLTSLGGSNYRISAHGNLGLHRVNGSVEWYSDTEGYNEPKGRGTVTGWTANNNIEITLTEGSVPASGDWIKNYLGDEATLYWFRFLWRQVEAVKGVYDWSIITDNPRYKFAMAKGMKLVYRMVMNWPDTTGSPGNVDIPQWLYDEIEGDGTWYSISYHDGIDSAWGFSPNYANSLIIQYHLQLIQAMNAEFGANTFHCQMGSLGHWGELHGYMPNESVQHQYYNHYLNTYGASKVTMRRNMNFNSNNGIGIYFDMLGHPSHLGGQWNQWWGLLTEMEGYTDSDGITHQPYPNFRQSGAIGGEHAPWYADQPYIYDYSYQTSGRRYSECLLMAEDLQMSYLYMMTPTYGLENTSLLSFQNNVDDMMRRLGYRFCVSGFNYLLTENYMSYELTIDNNGMAQAHTAYPVRFKFYDASDNLVGNYLQSGIDLRIIGQYSSGVYEGTVNFTSPLVNIKSVAIQIEGTELPMNNEMETETYAVLTEAEYDEAPGDVPVITASQVGSNIVITW